jgi:hypothetical protein
MFRNRNIKLLTGISYTWAFLVIPFWNMIVELSSVLPPTIVNTT